MSEHQHTDGFLEPQSESPEVSDSSASLMPVPVCEEEPLGDDVAEALELDADSSECEEEYIDVEDDAEDGALDATDGISALGGPKRIRKRRRIVRTPAEARLRGRRQMCKRIADIAPYMLKTVKLRIVGDYLNSTKGLSDDDLTDQIKKDAPKISAPDRVLAAFNALEADADLRNLKRIILIGVLLQEETHSLEESRLEEKVIEFEKQVIKRAKNLDFFDKKSHDETRWHYYDTYRIVLEAAWAKDGSISVDEANLLAVLRDHLNITMEEHWAMEAYIKRFPKSKCVLHTPDEIHEARKQLQKESLLWNYRDESDRRIDVIPFEVVQVLAGTVARQELQRTNYRRLLQNDSITLNDLRNVLLSHNMDRYGNKEDLIVRIAESDIRPSEVLTVLDSAKLAEMCRMVALPTSGSKAERITRLIDFYDDLTFEERTTQDIREEWYSNYELLAARSYSDLKAKKLINRDLEIEHQFERATDFLLEFKLHATIDHKRKGTKVDGRILLENEESILWDCKSNEKAVNVQDFLESQFDGYLRREAACGYRPLSFIVIGPAFTPHSLKLCHQYKARTNWDVALVTAEGLKHLAELWSTTSPGKPFPIRLLNRTDLIDKEKAEYLHSLA